ncbi:MAG: hypothetical protein NC433_02955 [Clostridiales bacterium]|nr:hypothetical protein [Clostridiales bacterium]
MDTVIEAINVMDFKYFDFGTILPELINIFGIGLIGGAAFVSLLHLASYAVFGFIKLIDLYKETNDSVERW